MAAQKQRAKVVEHGKFRIIIMEAPKPETVTTYITELKELGVTDVVRTCEPTYDAAVFEDVDIHVHEMILQDGDPPSEETLTMWCELICAKYKNPETAGVVAVHCVAGLGRAPVMAAIALIEVCRLDWMDTVTKIREKQKGAINQRQLNFLREYRPKTKASGGGCCSVM